VIYQLVLPLLKKLATIVLLNALLVLLFVWTSYAIASDFNRYPHDLLYVHWNFLGSIVISHAGTLVDGNYVGVGAIHGWFDFPSWLFIASTAINLAYILKLLKDHEPKKK